MVVNNPNWGEHRTETRSLGEGGKWMCVCVCGGGGESTFWLGDSAVTAAF